MDKVALWQVCLPFPVLIVIPPMLHSLIYATDVVQGARLQSSYEDLFHINTGINTLIHKYIKYIL
jgi:hypothetical protein